MGEDGLDDDVTQVVGELEELGGAVNEKGDFVPDEPVDAEQESTAENYTAVAESITEMAAGFLEGLHPAIKYDEQQRAMIASAMSPVLAKHGGQLPPWLEPWKEEIVLGLVLGFAGMQTVRAVKDHNAEQEKKSNGNQPEPQPEQ